MLYPHQTNQDISTTKNLISFKVNFFFERVKLTNCEFKVLVHSTLNTNCEF